jgi:hypothetical protein
LALKIHKTCKKPKTIFDEKAKDQNIVGTHTRRIALLNENAVLLYNKYTTLLPFSNHALHNKA